MLKFGLLYLNNGKWKNKQILPAQWVKESLTSHIRFSDDESGGYGFQFWIWSDNTAGQVNPVYAAMGNGDQNIFFDPVHHLLVVTTAGNYDTGNEKDLFAMLQKYIYPALFK